MGTVVTYSSLIEESLSPSRLKWHIVSSSARGIKVHMCMENDDLAGWHDQRLHTPHAKFIVFYIKDSGVCMFDLGFDLGFDITWVSNSFQRGLGREGRKEGAHV